VESLDAAAEHCISLPPRRESLADCAAQRDESGSPDCLRVHAASIVQLTAPRHD
jgi:hypothetical protein